MGNSPVVAIIQARTASSRLPSKVLKPLAGRPLLSRVIERTQAAQEIDDVVVATTIKPPDEAICEIAKSCGVKHFRGSEEDVLDRFYGAARLANAGTVVRITADCPMIDPAILDRVVRLYRESGCDYASNSHPPTFPDGLDVEVFSFDALARSWREAKLPSEREHVARHIVLSGKFRLENLAHPEDLSSLRWTVDEREDYEFACRVFEALEEKPLFDMADVLRLLAADPSLSTINARFARNEGLKKSLEKDRQFLEKNA